MNTIIICQKNEQQITSKSAFSVERKQRLYAAEQSKKAAFFDADS
jgi:hypothetical protein